ncbi:shikimate dehydrogenase [Bosea sp. 117]|uniref:shikimate dehydrogenase family protein n=1 Tax=Bosea sp. 117 TaxID=1125973 RepID=UPI0004941BFF|nr:shikimate dehydrogenase [Bosea sp. 117]
MHTPSPTIITGTTRIFFMLAHPIEHVRSPEVFNPEFERRGIDAVMIPMHFAPEDFAEGWAGMKRMRNLGGIVISVPLKEQALTLADAADETALSVGAANTVRREPDGRMVAANFDGPGFMQGLLGGGRDAVGRHALLVGAGGAGRSIAFSLAAAGVASVHINDVDDGRAVALAAEVRRRYPALAVTSGTADLAGRDLVINATPCGLHPETDPVPVDIAALKPGMIVADIVMKPRETPLLLAAQRAGCDVRFGNGMLDEQLGLMMRFFGY